MSVNRSRLARAAVGPLVAVLLMGVAGGCAGKSGSDVDAPTGTAGPASGGGGTVPASSVCRAVADRLTAWENEVAAQTLPILQEKTPVAERQRKFVAVYQRAYPELTASLRAQAATAADPPVRTAVIGFADAIERAVTAAGDDYDELTSVNLTDGYDAAERGYRAACGLS